jgi:hypothetical protein
MKALATLFQGPNGDVSSKRLSALTLVTAGIVFAFIYPDNPIMVGTILTAATSLLVTQALTKT